MPIKDLSQKGPKRAQEPRGDLHAEHCSTLNGRAKLSSVRDESHQKTLARGRGQRTPNSTHASALVGSLDIPLISTPCGSILWAKLYSCVEIEHCLHRTINVRFYTFPAREGEPALTITADV
ncbi:hypothetical protein DTO212C5_3885 [Paecilomyces variotii]|nr:hypothetical protein DTO212C5_3885 [Paecilomyces variotii]KAJ9411814.1 hypothetical protein DTO045G8_721 [Paecilomyces variotii]